MNFWNVGVVPRERSTGTGNTGTQQNTETSPRVMTPEGEIRLLDEHARILSNRPDLSISSTFRFLTAFKEWINRLDEVVVKFV